VNSHKNIHGNIFTSAEYIMQHIKCWHYQHQCHDDVGLIKNGTVGKNMLQQLPIAIQQTIITSQSSGQVEKSFQCVSPDNNFSIPHGCSTQPYLGDVREKSNVNVHGHRIKNWILMTL